MPQSTINLKKARKSKIDEFYTSLEDIENELENYKRHFKGKVVYCNCDDPRESKFFHYFSNNFEYLGLKKLITTCYKNQDSNKISKNNSNQAVYLEYYGDKNGNRKPDLDEIDVKKLKGDGDFRSSECIELLKEADVVVTNPPFSLFREYVSQLFKYKKKFLILGNLNAVAYDEICPFIKGNKLWLGVNNGGKTYKKPNGTTQSLGNTVWYTNLKHRKLREEIPLVKRYFKKDYPKYDNYKAIEVKPVKNIPKNYKGVMGVPISFMTRYNPNQFEIVKFRRGDDGKFLSINGEVPFARILIRNKLLAEGK